jgi:hypothetical protein
MDYRLTLFKSLKIAPQSSKSYTITLATKYSITEYLSQFKKRYPFDTLFFSDAANSFIENYDKFINKNPEFFNHKDLFYNEPKQIPKKRRKVTNGKSELQFRIIIEPKAEIKALQKQLLILLSRIFSLKASAFSTAFTKDLSIKDNVIIHKKSNHFLRIDLEDFFSTTSKKYLRESLLSLFEFGLVYFYEYYTSTGNIFTLELFEEHEELLNRMIRLVDATVELSTLNGSLPQGSPLSPFLSNIAMLKVDYIINQSVRKSDFSNHLVIYSRYADDMIFSSFSRINRKEIINEITRILGETPYKINKLKTIYYRLPGKVKLNGLTISNNHQVTIGNKQKQEIKRNLFRRLIQMEKGLFDSSLNMTLLGKLSFIRMIEPDFHDMLLAKYCIKFKIPRENFNSYLLTGAKE